MLEYGAASGGTSASVIESIEPVLSAPQLGVIAPINSGTASLEVPRSPERSAPAGIFNKPQKSPCSPTPIRKPTLFPEDTTPDHYISQEYEMPQPPTPKSPVNPQAGTTSDMITLPRDMVLDLFLLARVFESVPGHRAGPIAAARAAGVEWPKPAVDTQVPAAHSQATAALAQGGRKSKQITPVVSSSRAGGWPPPSLFPFRPLVRSAILTVTFSAPNRERRVVINNDPPAPVLQPQGNKPPIANQTLIIYPLPKELRIRDLVHSLTAPGGLRQVHFAPLHYQPQVQVAVVTFMDPKGAEGFKKYADKHGFFLSLRAPHGHRLLHGDEYSGETPCGIVQSTPEQQGVKKVYLVKKHLPEVSLRFWGHDASGRKLDQSGWLYKDIEAQLLKWFLLDDTWFCDMNEEIAKGATRQLKVLSSLEVVLFELQQLRFSPYQGTGGGTVRSRFQVFSSPHC